MKTLFVSWDGPGTTYLESLFLPIFGKLQEQSISQFDMLQLTWGAGSHSSMTERAAASFGIPYVVRNVPRGPQMLVTAAMVISGGLDLARYSNKNDVDYLMPRSIIPAAMALVAMKMNPRVRLIYDADGLKADERVDFGGWKENGLPYRLFTAVERAAVRSADVVLTRTKRATRILMERAASEQVAAKIVVVGNGKDDQQFHPGTTSTRTRVRTRLGVPDASPLIVYAGSWGPQYHPEAMMSFMHAVRHTRPDARLLLLTGALERANAAIEAAGLPGECVTAMTVSPSEVPELLAAADLGLALRTASFSQQAVAPIKVGEYLLSGMPVFATRGVGDLDEQLSGDVGWLTETLSPKDIADAAEWFTREVLPNRETFRDRCRLHGIEQFSLERTVGAYRLAYSIARAAA